MESSGKPLGCNESISKCKDAISCKDSCYKYDATKAIRIKESQNYQCKDATNPELLMPGTLSLWGSWVMDAHVPSLLRKIVEDSQIATNSESCVGGWIAKGLHGEGSYGYATGNSCFRMRKVSTEMDAGNFQQTFVNGEDGSFVTQSGVTVTVSDASIDEGELMADIAMLCAQAINNVWQPFCTLPGPSAQLKAANQLNCSSVHCFQELLAAVPDHKGR
eukprot:1159858-Pelagomonas_calceolata.AAC.3